MEYWCSMSAEHLFWDFITFAFIDRGDPGQLHSIDSRLDSRSWYKNMVSSLVPIKSITSFAPHRVLKIQYSNPHIVFREKSLWTIMHSLNSYQVGRVELEAPRFSKVYTLMSVQSPILLHLFLHQCNCFLARIIFNRISLPETVWPVL